MYLKGLGKVDNSCFANIKRKSLSYYSQFFICLVTQRKDNVKYPSFACIVSKKVGKAHIRNYAKRIFRSLAMCQLPQYATKNKIYTFIVRKKFVDASFQEVEKEFLRVLNKSCNKIATKKKKIII